VTLYGAMLKKNILNISCALFYKLTNFCNMLHAQIIDFFSCSAVFLNGLLTDGLLFAEQSLQIDKYTNIFQL
jgi:hypothetical protein